MTRVQSSAGAWKRRPVLAAAALLASAFAGCSDFTVQSRPNFGFIRVLLESSGGDPDVNGFLVRIGRDAPRSINSRDTLQSFYVAAGTHGVTLESIADNCSVQGSNPRSVSVEVGVITDVRFEIVCVATGIAVTMRTTGPDAPSTLSLTVSGQSPVTVPSNGSQTVGRLTAGSYTVTLAAPAHCTVSAGGQAVVTVAAKTVATVSFDVTCVPVARLEKIAYVDQGIPSPLGLGQVTLVNVDGTTPSQVAGASSPAWSPDGRTLAFSTSYCDWDAYYYYNFFCRGGLALLDPETGNDNALDAAQAGFHPAWSPNGEVIAFDVNVGNDTVTKQLRVLQFPSKSVATLTIEGPRSNAQPTWSPDGQRIAFVCRWSVNTDLCIVNANGGALVRLTDDAPADLHPRWSRDGRRIVFARHPAGRSDPASGEIVLIDVVTRQLTVLTKGTDPAWSRDGSRLVFAGDDGLFLIGADGANRTRLTTGRHRAPAWRP